MPRCLRIIKVVPRDVGNRMKKIKLLSRGGLKHRTVINVTLPQNDNPRADETSIVWIIRTYDDVMYPHVSISISFLPYS